ncbi:hypothetical protein HK414_16125 [Ramlibacter terrae]|uniref:AsmA-like C-terminal domain-containing protein n=1 Tax=Ramlibacter terrae TaxID=2732511 RepID=A0ABX6P3M7_9BURK|nr:hypothetical protein HK414_16125 [Ramlibacter terrae]
MVEGGFALTKSTETVTLSDTTEVEVDLLTIGASGVDAFAGINGGDDDELGLRMTDANFALAMMREHLGVGVTTPARSWMGLQASAGAVELKGLEQVEFSLTGLEVMVNRPDVPLGGTVVDFAASPLEVLTGPGMHMTLGMDGADGELLRATGHATLDVLGFFVSKATSPSRRRPAS